MVADVVEFGSGVGFVVVWSWEACSEAVFGRIWDPDAFACACSLVRRIL